MAGAVSSVALSGVRAAIDRIQASSHNVANLSTEGFRPIKVRQVEEGAAGGARVQVERASQPEPVDIVDELVSAKVASLQARASMRVLETDLDLMGSLLDTIA